MFPQIAFCFLEIPFKLEHAINPRGFNLVMSVLVSMQKSKFIYARRFNESVNLNLATGSLLKDGTVAITSSCCSTRSSDATALATSSATSIRI
jgi:hypothetical protein